MGILDEWKTWTVIPRKKGMIQAWLPLTKLEASGLMQEGGSPAKGQDLHVGRPGEWNTAGGGALGAKT